MAAVREGLGFLAARPAVPSLLGSLLREHQSPAQQTPPVSTPETLDPFSLPSEMSISLDEGFGAQPAATALAASNTGEVEEDFSLLDLSDEELEQLIDQDSPDTGKREETLPGDLLGISMDEYLDETFSLPETDPQSPIAMTSQSPSAVPAQSEAASDEEMTLNFDDFFDATDAAKPGDSHDLPGDSLGEPAWLKNEAPLTLQFEPAPEQAPRRPEESENDFVIDLSESDLDALLKRLEDDTKTKA
jgi:hypothetical protein